MAQRPYVFVNMAMTADGKIDTVERRGARISGSADNVRVDGLRADADGVMVGGRTLLAEDPGLTVRDAELSARRVRAGKPAQPAKIGVVSRLAIAHADQPRPAGGGIRADGDFVRAGGGRVVLGTTLRSEPTAIAACEALGATVLVVGEQRVDLPELLAALAATGIERLMVEGGSTLVAALLDAGLVDELQLAVAPLVFGGASAPTPVGGPGRTRAEAIELELAETHASADGDVVLRYLTGAAGHP